MTALATRPPRFVLRPAVVDERVRALGTTVRLIAAGPGARGAVARARAGILDHHARLSRFLPESELSALNADPRRVVPASALLRGAVRAGLWAAQHSGGLVDPCLLDALEAAGYVRSFEPGPVLLPEPSAEPLRFAAADPARRWAAIVVDDEAGTIARPPGLRLDLGGSGKGHAADLVSRHFARVGAWVVDCGGDIRIGGRREIQIAHPLRDEPAARIELAGGAVATSSIVARAWTGAGGRHRHHLLDPSSGEPVWTGLLSASALAPTTLHAETLAKTALLRGADGAREVLRAHGGLVVHAGGEVESIGPLPEVAR
jgi:thiamine biosynthesis lipoprotein